ncbi:phosphonate C-P lyase system protein PhnH [Rhizobium laguerreae]|uniref:phosphonate C-P lyase system protein PhnH n=1 Tax=Rhizobium laguerreae TaxID=1076926 RepID=UPI00103ACBC6|nr:phosphonate C-P lyase system protein PhnH [Rhizobium laguerreae]TBX97265.1 phosphonate C-P lyase system protein PhnH [Rhizobium laguerreae]
MSIHIISAPFENPIHETQQTFRALLSATSRPGTVVRLPLPDAAPSPFTRSLCSIALTLFDDTTPIWLDDALASDDVLQYLRFHTAAAIVAERSDAAFGIMADARDLSDFSAFSVGDATYPDRSATLIVQLPSLTGGAEVNLSGPGIEHTTPASPTGLSDGFWHWWNENANRYPCGIDMIFTDGIAVMGLPRTTKVSF